MRNSLAVFLLMQRDFAAAETELASLLRVTRKLYGDNAADTLMVESNLAGTLRQQGKLADAGPHCRAAMERARRVWRRCAGHDHLPQQLCLLVTG
ncbi:tetratricopeptide repeat protein [Xanthomonas populi]